MQLSKIISSTLLTIAMCACSASSVDKVNKTINPMADKTKIPREAGIERLTKAVCDTYGAHNGFGQGKKYANTDECMADYKNTFASKYTVEACGEPHAFDAVKFVQCESRAHNWEASSNVFDLAGFMTSCTAASVCK